VVTAARLHTELPPAPLAALADACLDRIAS